jgi:exosortase A-associated hydrolase 2
MRRAPLVGGRFIGAGSAQLAVVSFAPPPGVPARFAVLHVPAAFDEMNKARRMVALQARALASAGGCVVVYDPTGTGDSSGDHGDATLDRWRDDAAAAWAFMRREFPGPAALWGLRLGALVAATLAGEDAFAPSALLLWQPVASGRTFVNQFLRLAAAAQITGRADAAPGAKSLRQQLDDGVIVDVAGYAIRPEWVTGVSALSLDAVAPPPCAVVWRESTTTAPPQLPAPAAKIAQRWAGEGVRVDIEAVTGPSFWATTEIEESPQLIAATTDAMVRAMAATGVPAH